MAKTIKKMKNIVDLKITRRPKDFGWESSLDLSDREELRKALEYGIEVSKHFIKHYCDNKAEM